MQLQIAIRILLFILLNFSLLSSSCSNGYKIKITIEGMENQDVILAHYMNKSIYPDDTLRFNDQGTGVFKGSQELPQGMYIIYLPSGRYFELLMGEDQDFTITTDTVDYVRDAKVEGSEDNELFFEFQQYMLSKRDDHTRLQNILRTSTDEKEKEKARKELQAINEDRKDMLSKITAEHPDLFVSTFFRSTMEVEVPDPPVAEDGTIDSTWQYRYYKQHYFDNFDPHDPRLLRTPLYEEKIMQYLERVVVQIPDTLIREVDYLLDGARSDSVLFRYLLVTLFNYYGDSKIMGLDAVQVHLAEKYYLREAWWIGDDFRQELEERVTALKPLILGNVAPDIELLFVPADHFRAAANDSILKRYPHVGTLRKIHDIPGDFMVLLFWEAGCSHCKKAVPQMYKIYKEQLEPMGVKLVAISTLFGEEGKVEWIDFVNKHGLYDWMNAWNPYDYQYKITYDIRSTPQLFVLNKDKEIIGKRISPEQVPDLIRAYSKQFN